MASKPLNRYMTCLKRRGFNSMSRSLCRRFPVTTPTAKRATLLSAFNSSTRLYYNKDAFKKSRLDPEQPPKTWQDTADYASETESLRREVRLRQQLARLDPTGKLQRLDGLPFASKNNGFDGTDAVLEFNKPEQVKHIAMLEEMNKKGDFSYVGRKDESAEKFYNGDCAMTTALLPVLLPTSRVRQIQLRRRHDAFTTPMQRCATKRHYRRSQPVGDPRVKIKKRIPVWRSSSISSRSQSATKWRRKTGYLPITKAAYDLTREQGFSKTRGGYRDASDAE
ncbi:extracellular solute-binding protein [Escherichia coli]